MPLSDLDYHQTIALDYDDTLLGNGKHCKRIRDYVRNHPDKAYYIITFRTKQDARGISKELGTYGFDLSLIRAIKCLDENTKELGSQALRIFNQKKTNPKLFKTYTKDFMDEVQRDYDNLTNYKGFAAKQYGCTILVDDMPELCLPGCLKHHIEFLDSKTC